MMLRTAALVIALAWVSPAKALPSIVKEAKKHGLDGPPKVTEERDHRGQRVVWERWDNDNGRRWTVTTYPKGKGQPETVEGLQLNNGRYLLVSKARWMGSPGSLDCSVSMEGQGHRLRTEHADQSVPR
jgi:hypothetical protein